MKGTRNKCLLTQGKNKKVIMSKANLTINKRKGFLLGLSEDDSTEITAVEGKGASLGKLIKAGFPVPSGFVVTTMNRLR